MITVLKSNASVDQSQEAPAAVVVAEPAKLAVEAPAQEPVILEQDPEPAQEIAAAAPPEPEPAAVQDPAPMEPEPAPVEEPQPTPAPEPVIEAVAEEPEPQVDEASGSEN